jgi:hypothetical protein
MSNENSGVDENDSKASFFETHKTHIILAIVLGILGAGGFILYKRS